jgi:threonine dehydratase
LDFFVEIRELNDLNAAVRARRQQLNVSCATIDHVAGLQDGYCSKLTAPKPIKHLGSMSFGVMRTLGLRVVVIDDPDAFDAIKDRLDRKTRGPAAPASAVNLAPQLMRFIMAEHGRQGMRRLHRSMTPQQRTESARRAANARWATRKKVPA